MSIILISPVFEDRTAFASLMAQLATTQCAVDLVVAVDDGSVSEPLDLGVFGDGRIPGVILKLKRNVGHQRAIAIGIGWVAEHRPDARTVVILDSDGEDRPDSVPELISDLATGDAQVVVAERRKRSERTGFRIFYSIYRLLFWVLTGRQIRFGNFMAVDGTGLKRLAAMGETAMHVAASVLVSRLKWKARPIDRGHRYSGKSKMNFVALALHGFKALMVFAEDVLVRVGTACLAIAGLSIFGMVAVVVLKSIGFATPGWFSVALGVLVLMLLQTGAITLMTLMMTGILRNHVILPTDHRRLIACILSSTALGSNALHDEFGRCLKEELS